jgi:hypothetical protein
MIYQTGKRIKFRLPLIDETLDGLIVESGEGFYTVSLGEYITEVDFDEVIGYASHYDYLKEVLPDFFDKLAAETKTDSLKWEHNRGIISAHGDKCYPMRPDWEAAGLPFEKGVAIYLLTYCLPFSKEVREVRDGYQFNHKWVCPLKWVIDNKDRFINMLP